MPKPRRHMRSHSVSKSGPAQGKHEVSRGPGHASYGWTIIELPPGKWLALRFFVTFGLLALVYFTATLDLRLKHPEFSDAHPITARLAGANQWVRHTWIEPYQRGIAAVSAALLEVVGDEARSHGREIRSPAFVVAITSGCDAIEPSLLLWAAMLSFPASWRAKAAGALLGAAAIAALNIVRVVTLWLVGVHWRGAFDVLHFTVWPFLLILFALFVFVHWLGHVASARAGRPVAAQIA